MKETLQRKERKDQEKAVQEVQEELEKRWREEERRWKGEAAEEAEPEYTEEEWAEWVSLLDPNLGLDDCPVEEQLRRPAVATLCPGGNPPTRQFLDTV